MEPAGSSTRNDGTGLIDLDPWLEPYADALRHRYANYQAALRNIESAEGSLDAFSQGYTYFGFNREQRDGAPERQPLRVPGDESDLQRRERDGDALLGRAGLPGGLHAGYSIAAGNFCKVGLASF